MTDVAIQHGQEAPAPYPDLASLDPLVGTWKASDPTGSEALSGSVTYEWMEGGFFLIQRVDLVKDGRPIRGLEIIGHERPYGATEPSEDVKSRFYDSGGDTLDYVYEMDAETLTIWGGAKGSPAYYRGTFSPDGNTLAGGWVWPGGGYQACMTRITGR